MAVVDVYFDGVYLMKKSGRSQVEQSALQSVIDNARRSVEAGYPDFTADDPATFDADFIVQREVRA